MTVGTPVELFLNMSLDAGLLGDRLSISSGLLPLLKCVLEILGALPDQMKDETTESSFLKQD